MGLKLSRHNCNIYCIALFHFEAMTCLRDVCSKRICIKMEDIKWLSGFNEKMRSLCINCSVILAPNYNEIDVNILSDFDGNNLKIFSRSYITFIQFYEFYVFTNTFTSWPLIFNLIPQSMDKLNYEQPKSPLIAATCINVQWILCHHVLH